MNSFVENFNITEECEKMDIHSLTKTICNFGEETTFLPLQFKKMWFRLCNPNGNIRYFVLSQSDDTISVEARVYSDKTDNTDAYIGIGLSSISIDDIRSTDFISVEKRRLLLLPTARGLASSKALADAGFGLQFYGDLIDTETEIANQQEKDKTFKTEMIPAPAPKEPEKKVVEPSVKKEKTTKVVIPVEIPKPVSDDFMNPPETEKETTEEVPVVSTKPTMTVEEARKFIAPDGPKAGMKLGDIEKESPAYIKFLYGRKETYSEDIQMAIVLVAENNPIVKRKIADDQNAV